MPGMLVAVGGFASDRFRAAVKKLQHVPTQSWGAVTIAPQLALGWAGARERVDSAVFCDEAGQEVHVWRYGHTLLDGQKPVALGAAEILSQYLDRGVEACFEYDGSFVIVIADLRSQRLYIVPDRLCTQPLHYTRAGDDVVVGPEVKALSAALGSAPRLSTEGVVGFLAAGYNIGVQTLFAGVHRLELGKMLEISLDRPRRAAARRFWKLDFSASGKLRSRREAEDALFESIMRGHRLLLSDQPQCQILLSGGADSRAMLGACSRLGALPAKAVTWGLLPDTPRSDASISRALAEQFGVPWDFITTRTEEFIGNCEQWAYVSELSNDNFGWYTEGFGTLNYLHAAGLPCSLIGDESWGSQGFAYNEQQSHGKILPASVQASVLGLMPESARAAAAAAYEANLREAMRDCQDVDWNDRKDFLYLHGRVARFIFALGYYRGHVTEHRRPFLTRAVLDVVQRMPPEYRVFKNVYRTMMRRCFPEVMRVPYASVNSLPDWDFDLRTQAPLRACFEEILRDPIVTQGTLGSVFEPGRYAALRDAWFAQTPTPMPRTLPASKALKGQLKEALWTHPGYKYVERVLSARTRNKPVQRAKADPVDILRRAAVIVLLERQLHRFGETAPEPLEEQPPLKAASR